MANRLNPFAKKHTIYLQSKHLELVYPLFKSFHESAAFAIEGYGIIRLGTMKELFGKFTVDEIEALIEANRGKELTYDMKANKNILIENLLFQEQRTDIRNPISERYNFSMDLLIEKINNLTIAQLYFLQEEIWRFWKYESHHSGAKEDFIEYLIYGK